MEVRALGCAVAWKVYGFMCACPRQVEITKLYPTKTTILSVGREGGGLSHVLAQDHQATG